MIKKCNFCKKEFYVKPSHWSRRKNCSKECMSLDYKVRLKGKNNPNTKNGGIRTCLKCGENYISYNKKRKFCSTKCYSKSEKTMETRIKMSRRVGELSANWKGGRFNLKVNIRAGFRYRQWRSDVFTRDRFVCQKCGDRSGGNLEAHHIVHLNKILDEYKVDSLEKANNCEVLWNINNGITLCKKCHNIIHL